VGFDPTAAPCAVSGSALDPAVITTRLTSCGDVGSPPGFL